VNWKGLVRKFVFDIVVILTDIYVVTTIVSVDTKTWIRASNVNLVAILTIFPLSQRGLLWIQGN